MSTSKYYNIVLFLCLRQSYDTLFYDFNCPVWQSDGYPLFRWHYLHLFVYSCANCGLALLPGFSHAYTNSLLWNRWAYSISRPAISVKLENIPYFSSNNLCGMGEHILFLNISKLGCQCIARCLNTQDKLPACVQIAFPIYFMIKWYELIMLVELMQLKQNIKLYVLFGNMNRF